MLAVHMLILEDFWFTCMGFQLKTKQKIHNMEYFLKHVTSKRTLGVILQWHYLVPLWLHF